MFEVRTLLLYFDVLNRLSLKLVSVCPMPFISWFSFDIIMSKFVFQLWLYKDIPVSVSLLSYTEVMVEHRVRCSEYCRWLAVAVKNDASVYKKWCICLLWSFAAFPLHAPLFCSSWVCCDVLNCRRLLISVVCSCHSGPFRELYVCLTVKRRVVILNAHISFTCRCRQPLVLCTHLRALNVISCYWGVLTVYPTPVKVMIDACVVSFESCVVPFHIRSCNRPLLDFSSRGQVRSLLFGVGWLNVVLLVRKVWYADAHVFFVVINNA